VLLFFLNAYNLTFNNKPSVVHQWRQADCLSIAKNYYEEGMHFFQPKIHWQGTKEGKAVGEMPLINYCVAALWKVFGQKEGVYRLFNYFLFVMSMFTLFGTLQIYNKSRQLGFFLVSLLLTSPLLVYYSYNFLADVPALSLAIMSLCFFIRFYHSKTPIFFYLSLCLATLATLLKASALIPLCLIVTFVLIDVFDLSKKLGARVLFQKKILPFVLCVVAVILVFCWYTFAARYNRENHSAVFLVGVLPIWEMDEKDILKNLSGLLTDQFAIFFNRPVLFTWFISLFFIIYNLRLLDKLLKYAFLLSGIFFLFFIVFFFRVFDVHDYYLTNLMIFPVISFLCIAELLTLKPINLKANKWIITSALVVIVFNSLYSAAFYRLRTIKDDKICHWYPFLGENEKKSNEVNMWMYSKTMGLLETITPELRKIGIKRTDLFISVPDISPNASLYLMDQKGYTLAPDEFSRDTLWKSRCHFNQCKYFVISDTVFKDSLSFKLIAAQLEQVFKKERVEVYKIKN
jgi:hypothetical protein